MVVRAAADLFHGLPGEAMVRTGLADFAEGLESIEALLVQIGSPRLRLAGMEIQGEIDPDADRRLYMLLGKTHGLEAHSQYNSWIRQLVSFERALEKRLSGSP